VNKTSISAAGGPSKDISFGQITEAFWKSKIAIIATTAVFSILGVAYALLSKPVYLSEALIAPKEQSASRLSPGLLSQFGGLSSMMVSQLGIGSVNLARLEVLLKGRDVAEAMIESENLLPVLYPKIWDKANEKWKVKNESAIPTKRNAVVKVRESLKTTMDVKKNIIKVGAFAGDSTLAYILVKSALEQLNSKLRSDLVKEANANMKFLEEQISKTADPLLREKILQLMTQELEKSMLVNSNLFDILERPIVPDRRIRPQRAQIAITAFFLGLMASMFVVAARRFRAAWE
jgi:LPS O-antigen subunit length determinant protein (WzzB/FepE family)